MRIFWCTILLLSVLSDIVDAEVIEVQHFWTSGSESKAIQVLKDMLAEQGHQWKDTAITGGINAQSYLRSRVIKGLPPSSAMVQGFDVSRWARLGFLENLNALAEEESWDQKLPALVSDAAKFKDIYVATPVNIHRTNWMWANSELLRKAGLEVPKTWKDFFKAAQRLKQLGYNVIAQGNEPWQNGILFESLVLSVGGPEFYRQVFVLQNYRVQKGQGMAKVFQVLRELQPYLHFDSDTAWNRATQLVINGEAAFQFMGDWAKGEFANAGQRANIEYACIPVPGTEDQFLYTMDTFVMFRMTHEDDVMAQRDLARSIMSNTFQSSFNKIKGSIPVRQDISLADFDECAKKSKKEFRNAELGNALLPTVGQISTERIKLEMYEAVHAFVNNSDMTPEEGARHLAKRMKYGAYIID